MRGRAGVLLPAVTICTGMWRVAGSSLSWLSTVQPSMSGRKISSEMAVGMELPGEGQAQRAFGGDDALEALVARQAQQDARVMRVVLDDQQHRVALLDVVAVVLDVLFARDRQDREPLGRARPPVLPVRMARAAVGA